MWIGDKDCISSIKDNEWVRERLNNIIHYKVLKDHNHTDFELNKNDYFQEVVSFVNQQITEQGLLQKRNET